MKKTPGVIYDGDGSITQRTAAWAAVEDAQDALNRRAAAIIEAAFSDLSGALTLFGHAPRTSPKAAEAWRVVAGRQQELNRQARAVPELRTLVDRLDAALSEYHRIGGPDDRLPGVGGLA